jgi:ADP-ribosyl-[dinitrogen reductase] hydrolase
MENSVRGSCLCGGVRWEFSGPVFLFNHCHCRECRKSHGAAFASNLHIKTEQFRWLDGESRVSRFESSPGCRRSFCSVCGGNVAIVLDDQVVIPAASLDDPIEARPQLHFFAGEKVDWIDIADDIPAFKTWPPADFGRENS